MNDAPLQPAGAEPSSRMRLPAAVVTIGVFDGVHRGHQALVTRLLEHAARFEARSCAVTFSRHPLAVLDPTRCPPSLTSPEERARLLRGLGVDDVHIVDFDESVANTRARGFLESVVLSRYRLCVLVAGPDFAMGRDRRGDLGNLERLGRELGFEVDPVSAVPHDGAPVSSSRIRTLVESGDVRGASELLGRAYAIAGEVETGAGRGRGLGFPTANVAAGETRLLPANGVYSATVQRRHGGTLPAVVNVGVAPTFGGARRRVEAHILNGNHELVGEWLEVAFLDRLRGERRFSGPAELKSQIEADVEEATRLLGVPGLGGGDPAADS